MMPKLSVFGGWPTSGEIDIMESRANRNLFDEDDLNIGAEHTGSTLVMSLIMVLCCKLIITQIKSILDRVGTLMVTPLQVKVDVNSLASTKISTFTGSNGLLVEWCSQLMESSI